MELIEKEIITKVGYDNRGLIVRVERTDEEIVRCKDCRYWSNNECIYSYFEDNPNGYCAWGERRKDETD